MTYELKVDGLPCIDAFLSTLTSRLLVGYYETCNRCITFSKPKIAVHLINFGAHVNMLLIIKAKTLMLIKWSYRSPNMLIIIMPKMVSIF